MANRAWATGLRGRLLDALRAAVPCSCGGRAAAMSLGLNRAVYSRHLPTSQMPAMTATRSLSARTLRALWTLGKPARSLAVLWRRDLAGLPAHALTTLPAATARPAAAGTGAAGRLTPTTSLDDDRARLATPASQLEQRRLRRLVRRWTLAPAVLDRIGFSLRLATYDNNPSDCPSAPTAAVGPRSLAAAITAEAQPGFTGVGGRSGGAVS